MALNLGPSKDFMDKFAKNPPKSIDKKFTGGNKGGGKSSRLAKALNKKK